MSDILPGGHQLLSVRLPRDQHAPASARRMYQTLFSDARSDDVEVLISELVTNAVRYGNDLADAAGGLAFDVSIRDEVVRVAVSNGPAESPPRLAEGAMPHMPTGRGLRMLDELAPRWGFTWRSLGTRSWFEVADTRPPTRHTTTPAEALETARPPMPRSTATLDLLEDAGDSVRAVYWKMEGNELTPAVIIEAHDRGLGSQPPPPLVDQMVTEVWDSGIARSVVFDGIHVAVTPVIGSGEARLGVLVVCATGPRTGIPDLAQSIAGYLGEVPNITSGLMASGPSGDVAFLAEASQLLASSLDYAETMQSVADLVVPNRADWCTINVIGRDGNIRRLAAAHANPIMLPRLHEMLDSFPHDPEADTGVPRVIRTGEPLLFPVVPQELLEDTANDPDYLALTQELRISSCIIVPLEARGAVVGTMSLISTDHNRRRYGDTDLALARELGRRAGLAIDNSRLFTDRAYLAEALQRLLLPESLPDVPGLSLAARYVAARHATDVGGDFYDVVDGPDGNWYFIVGDVQGKGPDAATLIGLARHTVRVAAMRGDAPAQVLHTLNRALLSAPTDRACTAACVSVRPGNGKVEVAVARAGHPPPVLLEPAASWSAIEPAGMLLGLMEAQLEEATLTLAPGQSLVLYSDGVFHRDLRDEHLVYDRAAQIATHGAEAIADAMLGEDGDREDDVTVLVLQVG